MLEPGHYLQQRRYRIKARLNQGGMGTVYLATDRNLSERLVAIKENSDTFVEAQEQFQEEAVMLARLSHPNLPRVTDHFIEPSGRQYLVMDYVSGDDLGEVLRKRGEPLPEAEALAWMGQVMDALEYMHSWADSETGQPRPIIHRDIKPSNIKLTPDGRIVLVDFGISKYQTGLGTRLGAKGMSAGYSPIEQYTGGTDIRSDIYAFGATLYTLLTDAKPPDSPTIASGTPLLTARTFNPKLSRTTERVIERAMQIQPAARFQSIQEIRGALSSKRLLGFGAERRPPLPPSQPQTFRKTERPEPPARPRLWLTIIAILIVISVAVIVVRPSLPLIINSPTVIATATTEATRVTSTTPTPARPTSSPPPDTATPLNYTLTRIAATQAAKAAATLAASANVAQTSVPTMTIVLTVTRSP